MATINDQEVISLYRMLIAADEISKEFCYFQQQCIQDYQSSITTYIILQIRQFFLTQCSVYRAQDEIHENDDDNILKPVIRTRQPDIFPGPEANAPEEITLDDRGYQ